MTASAPVHASVRSERVKSWVWEVINPLLESLPTEHRFAAAGSATLDHHSLELQVLRPAEMHLARPARHILRDFRSSDPELDARIARHDTYVQQVRDLARKAFDAIALEPRFRQTFEQKASELVGGRALGDDAQRQRLLLLAATRVVNRATDVGVEYVDSQLWAIARDELMAFRTGAAIEALDVALAALAEQDDALCEWLEKKSFELCSVYDIPAAPVRGLSD